MSLLNNFAGKAQNVLAWNTEQIKALALNAIVFFRSRGFSVAITIHSFHVFEFIHNRAQLEFLSRRTIWIQVICYCGLFFFAAAFVSDSLAIEFTLVRQIHVELLPESRPITIVFGIQQACSKNNFIWWIYEVTQLNGFIQLCHFSMAKGWRVSLCLRRRRTIHT